MKASNLMKSKLTSRLLYFSMQKKRVQDEKKRCRSVPKIVQIGSGTLQTWAVKRSGPTFFSHPVHAAR